MTEIKMAARVPERPFFDATLGYPVRGPASWQRGSITNKRYMDSGQLMDEGEP
jgi:hypothetical protein